MKQTDIQSVRIHNMVEYIRNSGRFLCDLYELAERGIQNILREDFDIYGSFTDEEMAVLKEDLYRMAFDNEMREAQYLYRRLIPYDEGEDLLHSSPDNIYGKVTTYRAGYSYPVQRSIRMLPVVRYPLKAVNGKEMSHLEQTNKVLNEQLVGD